MKVKSPRGFRPFFVLASLFGTVFVPAWGGMATGGWPTPDWLSPPLWHAHEMVYGFAGAAVAGFLLTAVPNWAGIRPLTGPRLAVLAGAWTTGRIAMLAASALPALLVAALDLVFAVLLLAALAPPLLRADQRHNRIFIPALALFLGGNALFHLDALGIWRGAGTVAARVAVDAVLLLVVLVGGRIIPAFTQNALLRAGDPARIQSSRWLDLASIALAAGIPVTDLLLPYSWLPGTLRLATALALAVRMLGWQSIWTRHDPLLWSLHVGFACAPCGLALSAASDLGLPVSPMAGLHMLAIGCFGTLILSVMSRVALGHTGRELRAPRPMAFAYAAMLAAALLRTAAALLPAHWAWATILSSLLFCAGSAVFLAVYLPILRSPRADGKDG